MKSNSFYWKNNVFITELINFSGTFREVREDLQRDPAHTQIFKILKFGLPRDSELDHSLSPFLCRKHDEHWTNVHSARK